MPRLGREIASPDERGVTHLAQLEEALGGRGDPLAFLRIRPAAPDGWDLRPCPLLDRKAALAELLKRAPGQILLSHHLAGDGAALFAKIGERGGEGIVSKRADAPYTSGPSSTWLKAKHSAIGAFPVVGYVPNRPGSRPCWSPNAARPCG